MPRFISTRTRTLPDKPNLAQLRKQAKDLFRSYLAGDTAACREVERYEKSPNRTEFALADAQRILARAYGFSSWTNLKQHVDGVNIKAFCDAVLAGDIARVRKLAKARPELVYLSQSDEQIPLHLAVLQCNVEMTRTLMDLGSDARVGIWPHRSATTAYAIAHDRGHTEIVAVIEREEERRRQARSSAGGAASSKTDEVHRAILQGRNEEATRLLASDLSLVRACNIYGATPLHAAAWSHNTRMITWLLEHGASVDAEAQLDVPLGAAAIVSGNTPLDYAAIVAGWSAHGRHFSFMENSEKGPSAFAETVRLLREGGAQLTPRAAVAIGDREAVRKMHHEGRLQNEIHILRGGLLSIAVRVNRLNMVSLLLDLGLDPDEMVIGEGGNRTSWGMPLWFTAMCGRHAIAELLLARGADVNAIVFASGDALGIAHDTGDEELKALLRAHGARVTVEQVAAENDLKAAQAILEGRMQAYSLNVPEPTSTDLAEQMLWAAGGDSAFVQLCLPHMIRKPDDPWWNYVLLHATNPEGFKRILDYGVDPDVVGTGGYTILHHLASDYADDQTRLIRATILLNAGASLTKRDPLLRSTPLGWACRWGRVALVRLYLERGVNPHESDAEPWATPLAWATKGDHREIIELLQSVAGSSDRP